MKLKSMFSGALVAGLLAVGAAPAASATPPSTELTHFVTFGSGLGSGSTIGPGGDLYVTDGNAGAVLRIDRKTGDVSQVAEGLPVQVLGIGGAMDVAFIGSTTYVLVTLVGGDIVGGPHIGDDVVGIYRINSDGGFTPIADIGAWSVANPPTTDYFITTGVQYSLEVFRGGFVVADGHHNRVLHVTLDGLITEVVTYGNIVPTGLETAGNVVYVGQLGPVPHDPEDGKVAAVSPLTWASAEIASGARMIVDVEFGRGNTLYALSQGVWDGAGEGSPAQPNTGRLVRVESDGTLSPVTDSSGNELVLDRPTSMEFIGKTAYIISLTGAVTKIDNI
jgi:sugar lactone lactonase YvrE